MLNLAQLSQPLAVGSDRIGGFFMHSNGARSAADSIGAHRGTLP